MAVSETGLRLDIYRHDRADCSAGGISSRVSHVTLVAVIDRDPRKPDRVQPLPAGQAGPFEPRQDAPPVVLVYRTSGRGRICHVEPLLPDGEAAWFSMGGTYVTGDSRFSELTGLYGAVALHDRREW
jgi:hypothetical protein